MPLHGPAASTRPSGRAALASLPPEVPTLPSWFVARPDLIQAIKHHVLHGTDAKATTVTAPARKAHGPSNRTTTQGMGGVGKTTITAALIHDAEVRAAFKIICWVSVGQARAGINSETNVIPCCCFLIRLFFTLVKPNHE